MIDYTSEMTERYPDKPAGLSPRLKARQEFIRVDQHGGQIGSICWTFGDPAGVELVSRFGSCWWSRFGWPIAAWTDDVAWVAQAAVRQVRYLQMEGS